jgi:uncharacterized protein YlxP (DUF503 family)
VIVGCLEITLAIPSAHSLKEKRSVVKSTLERVRNKFNVSAAEVDANDAHQRAVVAIVAVGNDSSFVNSVIDNVRAHLEDWLIGRADVVDSRFELVRV